MKHGRQFVKSIIPGEEAGLQASRSTQTRTLARTQTCAHRWGDRRDAEPAIKWNRVHSDAGIWDEGGKREERFVLVDMAESFINTWLTRTLLGLAPWTPAEKQDCSAPGDKIHWEKERQEELRAKWQKGTWAGRERRQWGKDGCHRGKEMRAKDKCRRKSSRLFFFFFFSTTPFCKMNPTLVQYSISYSFFPPTFMLNVDLE